MIIRLTESRLRRFIRTVLAEQVVGYQAPSKSYDDPMADDPPPKKQADEDESGSGGDGGGYVSVGDMGVDVSLDSSDEEKASAMQVKRLTQQRQQALDKGDTEEAEEYGQELSTGRKLRG
jgi:hypothetical protein